MAALSAVLIFLTFQNAFAQNDPFPARQRLDTNNLIVYQVWLNYYPQDVNDDQPDVSVFANAAAQLPSIAGMGVTMIQLSPFQPFPGLTTPNDVANPPAQSPYTILNYYDVNPGYAGFPFPQQDPGTQTERIAALANYVAQAHKLGMKVSR